MKKALGILLIVFGLLTTVSAGINAPQAPNTSYLIGTFLPGLLFLILGLALSQEKAPRAADAPSADGEPPLPGAEDGRADHFKTWTNICILVAIVLMFGGSGLAQKNPEALPVGAAASLAGWALLIWGCVNYMRWKGYSGWFGLFGYLLLFGLILVFFFPNRRKRLSRETGQGQLALQEELAARDRSWSAPYLLTLVPLALIAAGVGALLYQLRSGIDVAEWKEISRPELGFQAVMPGTPRLDEKFQETPGGTVELYKFLVEPKGKKELFMIVAVRFPEAIGREFTDTEKLLALGRQDLLSAFKGQVQSEHRISLDGVAGLDLEGLPPKGAIVKARIFATKTRIYEVCAHVPKIRLASEDVQKFLDSFRLIGEPSPADEGRK